MATAVHVPVEEYLRTLDYEPDCEYVDGVIEERPMGQYDHASWQQAIQMWFVQFGKQRNIKVRPEYRVRVSATRYRVPDVCVRSVAACREGADARFRSDVRGDVAGGSASTDAGKTAGL